MRVLSWIMITISTVLYYLISASTAYNIVHNNWSLSMAGIFGMGAGIVSLYMFFSVSRWVSETESIWGEYIPLTRIPANQFISPWLPTEYYDAGLGQTSAIVCGEIIGWRVWVPEKDGRIGSMYVDYQWPHDEPALGWVEMGFGIFAFKERKAAEDFLDDYYNLYGIRGYLGQVALWGDVMEHRDGYRASHAKVVSLENAPDKIRKAYIKENDAWQKLVSQLDA